MNNFQNLTEKYFSLLFCKVLLLKLNMLRFASRKLRSTQVFNKTLKLSTKQTRNLNLLEYQSKELLRDCGVSVQNFAIVDDLNKANSALQNLR